MIVCLEIDDTVLIGTENVAINDALPLKAARRYACQC